MTRKILALAERGRNFMSREHAARIRGEILAWIRDENCEVVEVDFTDVGVMTPSFADELFAKMVVELGKETFRRVVHFKHYRSGHKELVNVVINNRLAGMNSRARERQAEEL